MHQPTNELLELAEQFYKEEQEEPVILGIDPAIASIGFGVIQGNRAIDYGVITTSPECNDDERFDQIYHDIITLCQEYKPNVVGLEEPFFANRVTTAGRVLAAYGVIKLALRHSGVGITEESGRMKFFSAISVKANILHGGASKLAVKAEVLRIFGLLEIKGADDAGDGLAIAYAVQQGATTNRKPQPKGRTKTRAR
jgi:crossover junction endodeoxyribonuclease RuvC